MCLPCQIRQWLDAYAQPSHQITVTCKEHSIKTPPTARLSAGRSHTQLLPFSRCARLTPLPSLRFRRPFAARRTRHVRDTGVCVPLPSAPLFAQRRALSRGVHWPCRARAPRSAPVRARCARTHLQRGAIYREGVPSGGGGAAHARARTATAHHTPGVCAGLRVQSADRALAVLLRLVQCIQPSSLVAPARAR